MKNIKQLDIKQLKDFLLAVATEVPIFIWGAPGIGKSTLIHQFSDEIGMECVTLLGSQLAPEDLIGIPQIQGNVSRFVPPSMIVRDKPFCLFIDEINIASSEVQKSFYSLILDHKIGEYSLPKGSIVIGAGNRASDSALVRQLPSALINRMVHVEFKVNHRIWLDWAEQNNVHPYVLDYIKARPKWLSTDFAPTTEEPFSSPRSWMALSKGLNALGEDPDITLVEALAYGCLTSEHAVTFLAFIKQIKNRFSLNKILNGEAKWPEKSEDRDILLFLVNSLRDKLIKELPKNSDKLTSKDKQMVICVKNCLKDLTHIDNELAQLVISPTEDNEILPNWFLVEISKELPKLNSYKGDKK